jgi:hypothetical protein
MRTTQLQPTAVRQRALGRGKLHDAERKGRHGGKGVQLDRGRRVEQRGKRHDVLAALSRRVMPQE